MKGRSWIAAALSIAALSGSIRPKTPEGYVIPPLRGDIRALETLVVAAFAAQGSTPVDCSASHATLFPQGEHPQPIPMANPKSCENGPFQTMLALQVGIHRVMQTIPQQALPKSVAPVETGR